MLSVDLSNLDYSGQRSRDTLGVFREEEVFTGWVSDDKRFDPSSVSRERKVFRVGKQRNSIFGKIVNILFESTGVRSGIELSDIEELFSNAEESLICVNDGFFGEGDVSIGHRSIVEEISIDFGLDGAVEIDLTHYYYLGQILRGLDLRSR